MADVIANYVYYVLKYGRCYCQRNTGGCSNYQHGSTGHWEEDTRDTSLNNENPIDEATNIETTQTTTTTTTSRVTSNTNKWVHNLSKTPLSKDQEKVLARGPNYAVVTKEPPVSKYIAQIERMCQKLNQGKAEELRGEVKSILRNIQTPKQNISKEEVKTIQELKRDQDKIILTTDKGVSMVVMEKEEYKKKSKDLLKQATYRELTSDPTNKYKNKLIQLLKNIKSEGGINNTIYERLYPTGPVPPSIMDFQKSIKLMSH